MNKKLFTLKDLCKDYENTPILKNINLDIYEGEFLTLLGPSGCGKTTILRLLAGFENPNSGEIILQEKNINNIPPEEREINTVFQSYALFPHMTIFDNVAFGLKMKKTPKDEIKKEVENALTMVKLSKHSHKKPHELSGGQQQRVAIARAVVNKPLILLLDESLSALDYKLRKEMQIELKMLQRKLGITFLFVTHDQEEALSMSDRIVVMNKGKIEQIGTPKEIYEDPKNLFVAQFIGEANCFETKIIEQQDGLMSLQYYEKIFHLKSKKILTNYCTILIRPEDFRVEKNLEDVKTNNYFVGELENIIYKGTTIDLLVKLEDGKEVIASEFYNEDSDALGYAIGSKLYLYWVDGWEVLLGHE
ncbi:MAG: spermidine/putrescine ABC transporter ATP-binding protein PotA [Arcobacter sp.]|jgi:spermidine/putrescine transport system ATP-binding protein|uniref:Spermidine/putrescine import ATP-binding protein PotA n=1 Tax=Arcobacter defluvii TaxID=873191 RepID=A0AAE7E7B3_9BACT|nr:MULTISPECIES: spermidine/putrescine ABC transporter ATP-binding protein PotA [Arcobacter]MDY3201457.1 spermidine/putrescine ABC transporter ATP-binding protein PotA [Arcobacter sp.]QKF78277.1 iron(III)/spermidine/putrescine ABC transporter, ATP-binding protein [Arcobacter defluvii]RXI28980.1 spermidine/putrescine ABC transporter ATP-binding protein PotA [Arcobacter defluvii]